MLEMLLEEAETGERGEKGKTANRETIFDPESAQHSSSDVIRTFTDAAAGVRMWLEPASGGLSPWLRTGADVEAEDVYQVSLRMPATAGCERKGVAVRT